MTPSVSRYHGDGGSNNDLTVRKYVYDTICSHKLGLDHSNANCSKICNLFVCLHQNVGN